MSRRGERLSLVAGSVLLALAVIEVTIHVIEARRGPLFVAGTGKALVQPHPVLGHEHARDRSQRFGADRSEYAAGYKLMSTNNIGLREDSPTQLKRTAGIRRILVLGDSQTDGFVANADSWPNVLERTLNRDDRRGVYEVLNAGVVAYQPIHEYLWWRLYGRQLQPDLVILGYFTGNDLQNAGGGRLRRTADQHWVLDETPRDIPGEQPWRRIARRCRLCALAVSIRRYQPVEAALASIGLLNPWTADERASNLCPGCLWTSLHQTRSLMGRLQEYRADLDTTEELLRRLRHDVESTGAKLLVMIIPSKLQVEGDRSGQAAALASLLRMTLPEPPFEDEVQADVMTRCARNGLTVLDLRSELRAARDTSPSPLYYAYDWHLNVRGNRAIGNSTRVVHVIREMMSSD